MLVEEFLDGQEVSLFLLSDGTNVLPLSPAQDYKRLRDGDQGPNTGGMGAYSPLPWLDGDFGSERAFVDEVIETIALPTVRQLAAERTPFIGLLYAGLILTPRGIRVIEFNARFGDPETQVVLPRLVDAAVGAAVRRRHRRARFAPPSRVPAGCRGHGRARERGLSRGPRSPAARSRGSTPRHPCRACTSPTPPPRSARPTTRVGPARGHRRPRAQRRRARIRLRRGPRRAYEALGHLRLEGGAVPHRHRRARRGVIAAP